MKVRKTLLVVAAGWAGLTAHVAAQIPVPPVPAPVGAPIAPTTPAPTTFWSKLGLSKEQKDKCRRELCATPLGQLINNAKAPLTLLSGGLVPPFCPLTPSAAQLADPGAEGAAAAIMLDEAGAKARRAAVRYLGTVDCHYWPEAEDALVAALRGDRNECVRWEAALALGRGCCCTKKTIEGLTIVVSCSDRDGAPKETSNRVQGAAAAALDHCLACYANVATVPVQGEKPIERTTPPVETIPPPATPPVPDAATAKGINPGEAKPAAGMTAITPPPVVVKRPVGPAYYAHVAKAPLAAVLMEARRVAEQHRNTPAIAETPFQSQGHSIATLMSYASGPDTQAVVPAGTTVPAGEMRAEVVSAKPTNLWDLLSKPSDEGQVVVRKTETVVVQPPPPPKPAVVKREVVVPKSEVIVKREAVAPKPEPVIIQSAPVAKKTMLAPTPAAAPTPVPMPKGESLTLDFPPPVATYLPPAVNYPPPTVPAEVKPAGPSPYFATAATPAIANRPSEPISSGVSSYHATAATAAPRTPVTRDTQTNGPSPYFATAATPAIANRPSEPISSTVSSYHATAATTAPRTPVTMDAQPDGPSPYFATAATPTITTRPSEPISSAVSSYHATAATTAPRTPMPMDAPLNGPSPYFATAATPAITNRPSEPGQSAVSSYHPTAATAAPASAPMVKSTPDSSPYNSVIMPAKPKPTPVVKATPPAPAPLPVPAAMPMPNARPMPPPAAPVVPAATVPAADPAMSAGNEAVAHLLQTAKGNGPVEVRKASIQELAKLKLKTPEVMAALDNLSDDPTPAVRAEAIIASARLRMGR